MSNEMHALTLYRHQGAWVYTDETFGRVHEPLVLGASAILDEIIHADLGYHTREPVGVIFSDSPFPGSHLAVIMRHEDGGAWYSLVDSGEEAWLNVQDYFHTMPKHLHVRVRSLDAS
jgi:hypothetical protein